MVRNHGAGWRRAGEAAIEKVLKRPLLDKLGTEVDRYQNKDFLKAVIAVCALTASADDEVLLAERCAITGVIQSEPALHGIDVDKANQILNDYISALQEDGDAAKAILTDKVRRMAGDHKRSRTLMRIAYLVISADYSIEDREMSEFRRLCGALRLEPDLVWRESEEVTAQRGDLGLS